MRRTRAADNSTTLATPIDTNTGGYYTAGPPATVFSVDDANILQEELVALATVKGASLDTAGTTTNQCAKAVESPANLITGSSTAISSDVSTVWKNGIMASANSQAGSDANTTCAVIAASNSKTTHTGSAIIGGSYNTGSAKNSVIVGGQNHEIKDNGSAAFPYKNSAIIAGGHHILSSSFSIMGGGEGNIIDLEGSPSAGWNFIFGGQRATSSWATRGGILGGDGNINYSTNRSVIAGGAGNVIAAIGTGTASDCFIGASYYCYMSETIGGVILGSSQSKITASLYGTILGSLSCSIGRHGSSIISSEYSHNPITSSADHVVILASRRVDATLATEESYMVVGGYDAGAASVAPSWKIESNGGTLHATNTTVQALDYAELFPNLDFSKHLPGRILTRKGKGVKLSKKGDRVIGVVSVCPNVVGGSDTLGWAEQWEKDEWGATIWTEVDEFSERDGKTFSRRVKVRKQNPLYDSSIKHTPRTKRPDEWTIVGLLGQIRVAVDSTVQEDDFIIAGDNGIGTKSSIPGNGRTIECMQIEIPFDASIGYGVALCLVG